MALILVADDDPVIVHLVSAVLRRFGHEVEATRDVATTVTRLGRSPQPACVVLDMQMPDGTASDVLARTSDVATGIPVLLLTGATSSQTERFQDEPRVRSILKKPVDPSALQRALGDVLGEPH